MKSLSKHIQENFNKDKNSDNIKPIKDLNIVDIASEKTPESED